MTRTVTKKRGRAVRRRMSSATNLESKDIQFMTAKEFAQHCSLSLTFVHTLMDQGTVKSVQFSPPGRQREVRRIPRSELERFARLAGQ